MKKQLFTLIAILMLSISGIAQTTIVVSGTVTDIATSQPVANKQVTILVIDSMPPGFYFTATAITNASGMYSVTIPNYPLNAMIHAFTYDCNNNSVSGFAYSSPYVINLSICTTTPPCQANFVAFPDSINPLTYQFQNTSTGNPTTFYWTFGDGDSSIMQHPTHTYAQPGFYVISLYIYGSNCQSIKTDSILIGGLPPCQAAFTYSVNPSSNLTLNFLNTSTGNPVNCIWSFGDGTSSNAYSPSHSYASAGTYTVTLNITGPSCNSTTTAIVVVGGNTPCQASFTVFPDSVNPMSFYFHNTSTGSPTSFLWNFGDGSSSTLQHPQHTYALNGVYIVSLTISDSGCTSTTFDSLYVGGTPSLYYLGGQVAAGSSSVDTGYVVLLQITPAGYTSDTALLINGNFSFTNIPAGTYYLLAALSPSSIFYGTFAPTYYGNALYWMNATPITVSNSGQLYAFALLPLVLSPGPGSISGIITGSGVKSPLPDVLIKLLNSSYEAVAFTYSNNIGEFSFTGLAYGNYFIWAEIPGKTTLPMSVNINQNSPNSQGNQITVSGSVISHVTGIEQEGSSSLFPNPFSSEINLSLNSTQTGTAKLLIFNLSGQIIYNSDIYVTKGMNLYQIPAESLLPGYFLLTIEMNDTKLRPIPMLKN